MPPFEIRSNNPDLWNLSSYAIQEKSKYVRIYFEKIEKMFEEEANELKALSRAENEKTKYDEDDSGYNHFYDDLLMEIEFIHLRMHRYSAILATYAYLEIAMNNICHEVERRLNLLVSVSDFKGDGVQRSKAYLEKLAGFDFNIINPVWSRVLLLSKVRNCIMHANGDAAKVKGSDSFIKVIEGSAELSFCESTLIMATKYYVLHAIRDIGELLTHLIGKLSTLKT